MGSQTVKNMISLESFDDYGRSRPILDSPRSLEACRRQGIDPEELLIKDISQMERIYKDGLNDRISLQVKLEHYEERRRTKLGVVRKERQILMKEDTHYYGNHSTRQERIQTKEVEDKLQKNRLLNQVRNEIKTKQVQLKDLRVQKQIEEIERKKMAEKAQKAEISKNRARQIAANIEEQQAEEQRRLGNIVGDQLSKEQRVQQLLGEKQRIAEQVKLEKQEFYHSKEEQARRMQRQNLQKKQNKVSCKLQDIERKIRQKQQEEVMARRARQEERLRDSMWKEARRKEVELQERKKMAQQWQLLESKEKVKNKHLDRIEGMKERYYALRREEYGMKREEVRERQESQIQRIQRQRRLLQSEEKERLAAEEQKRREEGAIGEAKRREARMKEQERLVKLEECRRDEELRAQMMLHRRDEKEKESQQRRRELEAQAKQKLLAKGIKAQDVRENRERTEKIQSYEKARSLEKYAQKVAQIQQEKAIAKVAIIKKPLSRAQIQQQVQQQLQIRQKPSRPESSPAVRSVKPKEDEKLLREEMRKEELLRLLDNMRVQSSMEEYNLMRAEEAEEANRKKLETTADNGNQLRRLQKLHQIKRDKFQEELIGLMKRNKEKVKAYEKEFTQV